MWSAVSPSGQWLAAAGFSSTGGGNPTLTLVDAEAWTWSEPLAVPELTGVGAVSVTDEGTVTWLRSETSGWQVHQLAEGSSRPVLVAQLEATLRPIIARTDEIGALTDEYLAVPTFEFDGDLYGGDTHIVIVDLTNGDVTSVPLEGVWFGHVSEEQDDGDGTGRSLDPGFGFDRDHDLLYVVSASEDEILVVDLVTSAIVRRKDVHEPSSLLSRVLEWWVPKADAKAQDGSRRNVALSPDGSRLYVATARAESEMTDGEFRWQDVPLGVEVIDTDSLTVISRTELPVSDIAISPDGAILMAVGVHEWQNSDGYSFHGFGVYLLDANNLSVVAHLDDGVGYDTGGFAPDGSYAYAWSYRPSSDTLTFLALDPSTGATLGSRDILWPGYLIEPLAVVADRNQ
jgi:hypothetical protein